jgi:hypothetical protein
VAEKEGTYDAYIAYGALLFSKTATKTGKAPASPKRLRHEGSFL